MKTKMRLLGLLLTICVLSALMPVAAFAGGTVDKWDGTFDTSWYDDKKTEFEIDTAEKLAGLAVLVNGTAKNDYTDYHTFEGKVVKLTSDLDLSGHEWVSIGSGANFPDHAFCGTFDGNHHVIKGLYSHQNYLLNPTPEQKAEQRAKNTIRMGLFGAITNATIKNLGVEDADILCTEKDTSTYGKGIIADWCTTSKLYNCYTTGKITGGSYIEKYVGGLVGFLNGNNTIQGCYSQATITGNYQGTCYKEPDSQVKPMDVYDSLGGIAGGWGWEKTTITDCWFDGKIVVNSIQAATGGIIGVSNEDTITNCLVAATDLGNDGHGNTVWVGFEFANPVKNCVYPDDPKYGTAPANYPQNSPEIPAGLATKDFKAADVLAALQAHAASGVKWVEGIHHPTFDWDKRNIPADYAEVKEAVEKANGLEKDKDQYTNFDAVTAAVNAVDYGKSQLEQQEVTEMAQAINAAIANLKFKPADYAALDAALAAAGKLKADEYVDFSQVKAAIEAAKALDRNLDIRKQQEVTDAAKALEAAMKSLKFKPADYAALDAALAAAGKLKADEYVDFSQVKAAIEAAKALDRNLDIRKQKEVDAAAKALEAAMKSLKPKPPVYAPVVDAPAGGSVTVNPAMPKAGDEVAVTVKPPAGKVVDTVTVTDENGKSVPVTRKADGTYTFIQPKGKVKVTVTWKDEAGSGGTASGSDDDSCVVYVEPRAYVSFIPKTGDVASSAPAALALVAGIGLLGFAAARKARKAS